MSTYLKSLERACDTNHSLVCVGLDPEPSRQPVADVFEFNRAIVEATADLVCAYKPNLSFYEALGLPGLRALEQTIQHIRQVAPQAQIIGDAKRGDGGPSAAAYARAMFQVWGFDAVTVNPWGGADTVQPLSGRCEPGRICVVSRFLCRRVRPARPKGGLALWQDERL
jgi:orotidine 5'-phosphate decarboxylase subfamily 2